MIFVTPGTISFEFYRPPFKRFFALIGLGHEFGCYRSCYLVLKNPQPCLLENSHALGLHWLYRMLFGFFRYTENSEKVCKPLILGSAYFRKQLILL
jgi:hypothetical protein